MADALELTLALLLKDAISDGLDNVKEKISGVGPAALGMAGIAVGAVVGVGAALLDAAKAASEEEEGIAKLAASVRASGGDWDTATEAIEKYLAAETLRTGLDDGEGREAIARLTQSTGSYEKALSLMAVTQDLARAKGMDLAMASELIGRVANGNTSVLTRYGVTLSEGATAQEALAEVQAKFAGQAEAWGDSSAGAAAKYDIAMGNLKETVGGYVLPVLTELATNAADLATRALPLVTDALDFIVANKEPILVMLAAVAIAIGATLIPAFIAWAAAAWAAAVATITALAPIMVPILAIGAAVALLVAAWKNDWGGIRTTLTQVWEGTIKPAFDELRIWLDVNIPRALDSLQRIWSTVTTALRSAWETAWSAIENVFRWFSTGLTTLGTTITTTWNTIYTSVTTFLTDTLAAITGFVTPILDAVTQPFEDAWEFLFGSSLIPEMLEAIGAWLADTLASIVSFITNLFNSVIEPYKQAWDFLFGPGGLIDQMLHAIAQWLANTLASIVGFIVTLFNAVVEPYKQAWEFLFGPSGLIPQMLKAIAQWLTDTVAKIGEFLVAIRDAVVAPFKAAYEALFGSDGIIPRILSRIGEWLSDVVETIGEWLGRIRDAIEAPFLAARDLITGENGVLRGILTGIVSWFGDLLRTIGTWLTDIRDALIAPFLAAWEKIKQILGWILGAREDADGAANQTGSGPVGNAGGFALGGSFLATGPTMYLAGERGPERVTVTPLAAAAGNTYVLHYYATQARPGRDDAAAAMRRLEWMVRTRQR